jgi:hypothetical protein
VRVQHIQLVARKAEEEKILAVVRVMGGALDMFKRPGYKCGIGCARC